MTYATEIACPRCEEKFPLGKPHNLCPCGSPLFVRYDAKKIKRAVKKSDLEGRAPDLWRYREVVPLRSRHKAH